MWRDSLIIILKTPYCIGTLLALVLNLMLPAEDEDAEESSELKSELQAAEAEAKQSVEI